MEKNSSDLKFRSADNLKKRTHFKDEDGENNQPIKNIQARKRYRTTKVLKDQTKLVLIRNIEERRKSTKNLRQKDSSVHISKEILNKEDHLLHSALNLMINKAFAYRRKALRNAPPRSDQVSSIEELRSIKRRAIMQDKTHLTVKITPNLGKKKNIHSSSRNLAEMANRVVSSLNKTINMKKESDLKEIASLKRNSTSYESKTNEKHNSELKYTIPRSPFKISQPSPKADITTHTSDQNEETIRVTTSNLLSTKKENKDTAHEERSNQKVDMRKRENSTGHSNSNSNSNNNSNPNLFPFSNVSKITKDILTQLGTKDTTFNREQFQKTSKKEMMKRLSQKRESMSIISNESNQYNQYTTLPQILAHEKFRELSVRHKVDDSLSLSEDNVDMAMHYSSSNYVINPDGMFKKIWDGLLLMIIMYTLLMTPYFISEYPTIQVMILDEIFDVIFIIDVVLNFFVAYYTPDEDLIKNLSLITFNYISGFFIFDLAAAFPSAGLLLIADHLRFKKDFPDYIDIVKFNKLIKILKFGRSEEQYLHALLNMKALRLTPAYQRLIKFLISFTIISHFISCLWIYIGKKGDSRNWIFQAKLMDASYLELYVSSLYFHWTTIFTIGYGDIISTNTGERLYNSMLMFVGILVYSFAVSSLGSMITSYDSRTMKYHENLNYLEELSSQFVIPDCFYMKLAKHLKYNFNANKSEKFGFINDLPDRIKIQLLADMHKETIRNFRFFTEYSLGYMTKVVSCMKPIRVSRKEYLVSQNEFLEEMFFIKGGTLGVFLGIEYNEAKVIDLMENEHFGDILIDSNERSPFNLKASSKIADLMILRKEDFNSIKEEFPNQLLDSISVSFYNYSSMLDLAEKRKKKFVSDKKKEKMRKTIINSLSQLQVQTKKTKEDSPFFGGSENIENIENIQKKEKKFSPRSDAPQEQNAETKIKNNHVVFLDIPTTEISSTNQPQLAQTNTTMNMYNFNFIVQNNKVINSKPENMSDNEICTSSINDIYNSPLFKKRELKKDLRVSDNSNNNSTNILQILSGSGHKKPKACDQKRHSFANGENNMLRLFDSRSKRIEMPSEKPSDIFSKICEKFNLNADELE